MTRVWTALLGLLFVASSFAQAPIPAPPQLGAVGYLLVDFASDRVIAEKDADVPVEPASITKLMTAYAVFKALEQNQIALDDQVRVSEKAWRTQGSRMFIEVDTEVSVEDLLRGMIIQSGNDASVALAEHVAGSEETFVRLMNQHAAMLGMTGTNFENPTGLPGDNHVMTARDIALLAKAIVEEFPEYYGFYSEREFTYNGIRQHNRNSLLWRDQSVDGLKTGHTDAAGYCLVTSAERDGMRLISVVLGASSPEARADASQALLGYGFRFFETHRLYARGEEITTARVWKGEPQVAALGLTEDLYVTIPRGKYESLSAVMDLSTDLVAPLQPQVAVGAVRVSLDGEPVSDVPLVLLHEVAQAGFLARLKDEITRWLQ
ncbi:MAG: D-alanyl-D-alanine carboxypeptidase [Gammaproteobacteria bacterium]|nr:D-alanyl-D-alanine carboxypeptidase [Gammaproteobacteria bacterium]MDH3505864.1 D-alanyl-D-alanine carboxypeptidase [Gammaproteobacteria bacterium]